MPITPELKSWDCSDIQAVEDWMPGDSEVIYWLTLAIGPPGSPAADNFQVCIATPAGLKSPLGQRAKPRGRQPPAIVLLEYSWPDVLAGIRRRLQACAGSDWLEIQEKLRRQFAWEYEGMSRLGH